MSSWKCLKLKMGFYLVGEHREFSRFESFCGNQRSWQLWKMARQREYESWKNDSYEVFTSMKRLVFNHIILHLTVFSVKLYKFLAQYWTYCKIWENKVTKLLHLIDKTKENTLCSFSVLYIERCCDWHFVTEIHMAVWQKLFFLIVDRKNRLLLKLFQI